MSTPPRKKKRFLAPQEKYEIWMQLVKGEITIGEAADRSGVDRSTIAQRLVQRPDKSHAAALEQHFGGHVIRLLDRLFVHGR